MFGSIALIGLYVNFEQAHYLAGGMRWFSERGMRSLFRFKDLNLSLPKLSHAVYDCKHSNGIYCKITITIKGFKMKFDSVIIWANLIILILLLIKFAGKPFMDFLRGRKEEISSELRHLETEREIISVKIKEAMKTLDERKTSFARLEENITRQGESKKSEIISKAGEESIMIIEKAKRNAEIQLFKEKEKLRADMTDQTLEIPPGKKHLK